MAKKIMPLIAAVCALLSACSGDYTRDGGQITTIDVNDVVTALTQPAQTDGFFEVEDISGAGVIFDRTGRLIEIPDHVGVIVSTSPALTEILIGLGLGGNIAAADTASRFAGLAPEICVIDFMTPDTAYIAGLSPDVVFVGEMTDPDGLDDLYDILRDAGVNAVYMPASDTIEEIKSDIMFLAEYTGRKETGEAMADAVTAAVNDVYAKTASVAVKKTVYFEIGAEPCRSFGSGTLLNELVAICGGVNVFAERTGYFDIDGESAAEHNPDVIISSVSKDGYDYNEIYGRGGWENVPAVLNGQIYSVRADVGAPSQHVAERIYLVAEAVYPDIFGAEE